MKLSSTTHRRPKYRAGHSDPHSLVHSLNGQTSQLLDQLLTPSLLPCPSSSPFRSKIRFVVNPVFGHPHGRLPGQTDAAGPELNLVVCGWIWNIMDNQIVSSFSLCAMICYFIILL